MDLHCIENTDNEVTARFDKTLLDDKVLKTLLDAEDRCTPIVSENRVYTEITPHMREIVSTWMMEVCDEQKCQDEVFLIAMNYFNRFLNKVTTLKKNQLQLVGATCMLIASKFREPKPLNTETLVYYTEHSIRKDTLWNCELLVLATLDWDISPIVAVDFLPHILSRLPLDRVGISLDRVKSHAKILITLCAKEYQFAGITPSILACASVASALKGLSCERKYGMDLDLVLQRLHEITEVDVDIVRTCMERIEKLVQDSSSGLDEVSSEDYPEVSRPEEFTPPPVEKYYGNYNQTAVTPTDVRDVHF